MKKITKGFITFLIILTLIPAIAFGQSEQPAEGFYDLDTEEFRQLDDFLDLNRSGKIQLLSGNYYFVFGSSIVLANNIIALNDTDLFESVMTVEEFQNIHEITLTSDGKIVPREFEVIEIE